MKKEVVEKVKERLFRKGFGEEVNYQLGQALASGEPEFILDYKKKFEEDEMYYKMHFRCDHENDKLYLNDIDAFLVKNADAPGEQRGHTFPSEQLITIGEAYRMLKYGDLVAVNKTLYNKEGVQYNTWLSLDLNGPKDQYGNYPVHSYHENYFKKHPFILEEKLKAFSGSIKELTNEQYLQNVANALKKAKLVPLTAVEGDREIPITLSVNPKAGDIDVLESSEVAERIKQFRNPEKATEQQLTEPAPHPENGEVKKKPWKDQQPVKWKPKQNKGMSL